MKKPAFIPVSYNCNYYLTEEKKTFQKFEVVKGKEISQLPSIVRIEKNNGYNCIKGANYLLRIRDKSNWQKCQLAGLRPEFCPPNFYYSDLLINGKKSLIIVFWNYDSELTVKVCPAFYPYSPNERQEMINYLISNF